MGRLTLMKDRPSGSHGDLIGMIPSWAPTGRRYRPFGGPGVRVSRLHSSQLSQVYGSSGTTEHN